MTTTKDDNLSESLPTLDGPQLRKDHAYQEMLEQVKENDLHADEQLEHDKNQKPQLQNVPKLIIKIENQNTPENQPNSYFTTNVPLQEIERDFQNYLQDIAADRGISVADLEKEGYKCEYNDAGNVLTLSFPNSQHSQEFFNRLQKDNKINGPFDYQQDLQNPNTPRPQPGSQALIEDEKLQKQNGYVSPSPFKNLGDTPELKKQ